MNTLLSGTTALAVLCLAAGGLRAQDVASGEKVFKAKCISCHGPDGKGDTTVGKATKARNLSSEEVKNESDATWTEIITKGKNKMPSYDKKISDAEVKDVIAYVRTLIK